MEKGKLLLRDIREIYGKEAGRMASGVSKKKFVEIYLAGYQDGLVSARASVNQLVSAANVSP